MNSTKNSSLTLVRSKSISLKTSQLNKSEENNSMTMKILTISLSYSVKKMI